MNLVTAVFYSPLSVVTIVVFLLTLTIGLDIKFILTTSFVIYFIGLASTILLGIPTHLILNKLDITNGIAYILVGLLAPIFLLWMGMLLGSKDYSFLFFVGIVSGLFGAFCAYVFWLYVVPSKPIADVI